VGLVIYSVDDRKFTFIAFDLNELTVNQKDAAIFLTIFSGDIGAMWKR